MTDEGAITDAGIADARDDEVRTVDGRLPGRRGRETRKRLLEVTVDMLRAGSYRDLAVVDIAREAGVSPATFYQYFPDVETAIFVIADHITTDGNHRLSQLVAAIDLGAHDDSGARALAEGFVEFWQDFDSILRVLDLGAAERDVRFRSRRTQLLSGPTDGLRAAIASQQATGALSHSIDPAAMAAVLTAMLAHVAAHRGGLSEWGVVREDLLDAMGRIVHLCLTDTKPG
jgi:AcrR family transcriptional regulator